MNDVEMDDDAKLAQLRREVRKRYDEIDRVTRNPELQAIPDFTSRYIGDLREESGVLNAKSSGFLERVASYNWHSV